MPFLTLRNHTPFPAVFVVRKGQQTIARTPALAPGGELRVSGTQTRTVVATTVIEGNTYTSAPITVTASAGFLARVLQHAPQGTYLFDMQEIPPRGPDCLEFQTTTSGPVTFTISNNGAHLQTVVVKDAFNVVSLPLAGTYSIYAIINGITTDVVQTDDADAVVTAIEGEGTSALEHGDYRLVIG
ncbi:MAG: hypothetical protein J0M09_14935 [Xanthomonadales bacterium]|nr:hypothetical protein [Xanthomonadales bacterium]